MVELFAREETEGECGKAEQLVEMRRRHRVKKQSQANLMTTRREKGSAVVNVKTARSEGQPSVSLLQEQKPIAQFRVVFDLQLPCFAATPHHTTHQPQQQQQYASLGAMCFGSLAHTCTVCLLRPPWYLSTLSQQNEHCGGDK